jgi:hypothetical protein
MSNKTKWIILITLLALGVISFAIGIQDRKITDGRFNNYGDEPWTPPVTTTTIPEPKWEPPPPPPPPKPEFIKPKGEPTPFDTGDKVRKPWGCREGEERGVDC